MVDIINLDDCKLGRKNGMYGGAAGNKDGIIYNGESWLIKYPKNIAGLERTGDASYSTSPLCEYIGSHIFAILGFDVHQTFLAFRHGKIVVACKDFATKDDLVEIRTIKNHANEELSEILEHDFSPTGSNHVVDLEELLLHLRNNDILCRIQGIEKRFWEQAVVDVFINNNDRNNGNWGILRDEEGNDRLAPIFDNGGCLQTKISEDKIKRMLSNPQLLIKNATNTQTAYGIGGHALSATHFLELYNKENGLKDAIKNVAPNISKHKEDIFKFINDIPEIYVGENGKNYIVCSDNRKKLYSMQLQARLEGLLLPYYNKIPLQTTTII